MNPDERERFYKGVERLKLQKIALDQRKQKLDQRKYSLSQRRLEFIIYRSLTDNEKNTNYGIWVKQFREKIKFEKALEENPILAKMYEELSTIQKELNAKKEMGDNRKHEIEKGLTETKFNLLNAEWNLFKPDIEHLHRENIKKASELTDD